MFNVNFLTNSVDVTYRTIWEVIIDDKVNSLEVHASPHQLGTDQHPDLATAKTLHNIVSLKY